MNAILDAIAQRRSIKGIDERTLEDLRSDHVLPDDYVVYLRRMGATPPTVMVNGKKAILDVKKVRHKSRSLKKKGHWKRIFNDARENGEDFLLIGIQTGIQDEGHYYLHLTDMKVFEVMESGVVVERARSLAEFLFGTEFPEIVKQ